MMTDEMIPVGQMATDVMHVLHDPGSGAILAVMDAPLPQDAGLWLAVPAFDPGNLSDWRVEAGALVRVSLDGSRARAISRVNAAAGHIRRRYITVIEGQELIYQEKRVEAVAYLADADPDLDDYPFIAAEVGSTAETAQQVAQVYVNMSAILRAAGATLEHYRIGAIVAIEAAVSTAEIDVAVAAFEAGLTGFG